MLTSKGNYTQNIHFFPIRNVFYQLLLGGAIAQLKLQSFYTQFWHIIWKISSALINSTIISKKFGISNDEYKVVEVKRKVVSAKILFTFCILAHISFFNVVCARTIRFMITCGTFTMVISIWFANKCGMDFEH